MNNHLGLHLRLDNQKVASIAQQAQSLNLSRFQFFVTAPPDHDRYLRISQKDRMLFMQQSQHCTDLYIHSSYWINPSTGKQDSYTISKQLLKREIHIAKQLGVRSLVLHGGSAKGYPEISTDPLGKMRGIQTLAKTLNTVLKNEQTVKILLENTAHGNHAIGSDLHDFVVLKEYLNFPERIGFCIDFAHAHSFGYDVSNPDGFAHLLDNTLGLDNIKLLHVNDTDEQLGSKKDRHAIPGLGKIGKTSLIRLISSPHFINIPKVCELPAMSLEQMQNFLDETKTWTESE